MNLVLLSADDLCGPNQAIIRDQRRLAHISQIHNAQLGQELNAGILNGAMGKAVITHLDTQQIHLQLQLDRQPPPPLPLTLILGLPRPKMLRRIFQTIATLGVKQVYLINSYRVEKSYWQTPFLQDQAIREQLLLGLEQGCDTLLPQVHLIKRFKPFVEDELPGIIQGSQALVAHPYTHLDCPRQCSSAVSLAVGPEGGFIPYEIDLLQQAGFTPVTLGQRIMRVETAIPFLLSRLF